tara:strand:- start:847 stop:1206 length:360 start_codon:yes stop_codon:yes gene_type:complete
MGDDDYIINIDNGTDYSVTYTSTADPTISLDLTDVNDSGSEFTYNMPSECILSEDIPQVDFDNSMPSIYKINDMCKHYPALAKAYENFRTIYKMVDQDYKGNHEDKDDTSWKNLAQPLL